MTECRIEYWNKRVGDWGPGHAGIGLRNPEKYVAALQKKGILARVTDLDSGEVIYAQGGELL